MRFSFTLHAVLSRSIRMNLVAGSFLLLLVSAAQALKEIWDEDTYARMSIAAYDSNGDGKLSRTEFENALSRDAYNWASAYMRVGDANKDGLMNYDEFREWFTKAGDQLSTNMFLMQSSNI